MTRKKISSKHGTAKTTAIPTMANSNRFTVLPVHETSEDEDEVIEIDNATKSSQGKSTTSPNKNPSKYKARSKTNVKAGRNQLHLPQDEQSVKHKSKDHEGRPKKDAAIVGNSMIKFIDARKLRHSTNMKIAVKTFPGAKTEDDTLCQADTQQTAKPANYSCSNK